MTAESTRRDGFWRRPTSGGWPPVNVRHRMLAEAVEIIRSLWAGGYVDFAIPCGQSVEAVVEAVKGFTGAGFTHVALCQIGEDTQRDLLDWWRRELGPALGTTTADGGGRGCLLAQVAMPSGRAGRR